MSRMDGAIKDYEAAAKELERAANRVAIAAIMDGGSQLMTVRELVTGLGIDPYPTMNSITSMNFPIDPRAAKYATTVEPWHWRWTKQVYMPAHRILEASGFNKRFEPPVTISRRLEY